MTAFSLSATASFLRHARSFFRKHPELKQKFGEIATALQEDPFQPHLGLHALKGKLQGLHAIRITHQYRLTLTILLKEHEIVLIDIGSHDDVYR